MAQSMCAALSTAVSQTAAVQMLLMGTPGINPDIICNKHCKSQPHTDPSFLAVFFDKVRDNYLHYHSLSTQLDRILTRTFRTILLIPLTSILQGQKQNYVAAGGFVLIHLNLPIRGGFAQTNPAPQGRLNYTVMRSRRAPTMHTSARRCRSGGPPQHITDAGKGGGLTHWVMPAQTAWR